MSPIMRVNTDKTIWGSLASNLPGSVVEGCLAVGARVEKLGNIFGNKRVELVVVLVIILTARVYHLAMRSFSQ